MECSLPAFEGLFGEPYDEIIQDSLFALCYWHGLAKLRLHSTSTLKLLEAATSQLGAQLRRFVREVCNPVPTHETKKEAAARHRRAQKAAGLAPGSSAPQDSRKDKTFNLNTFKWHSLADYVATIFLFGTSDSYSTQAVCTITSIFSLDHLALSVFPHRVSWSTVAESRGGDEHQSKMPFHR